MSREIGTRGTDRHGVGARTALLVLAAALLLAPACSDDDDQAAPTSGWRAPAAMQGDWTMSFEMREHDSGQLVSSDSYTGVLCAGEAAPVDLGQGITCNSPATADGFRLTCTQTQTVGDCTVRMVIDLTFVCTDDTMTGTGTATGTYSGSQCALAGTQLVFDVVFDGAKTGPAPDGACTGKSAGEPRDALVRVPGLPWWR